MSMKRRTVDSLVDTLKLCRGEPVTVCLLAEHLGCDKHTASDYLAGLTEQGLLIKRPGVHRAPRVITGIAPATYVLAPHWGGSAP